MKEQVTLTVNGEQKSILIQPWQTLLSVLRDDVELTGAKNPCGVGECGACTVLVDGRPVNSCLMLAKDARGKEITTIEGIAPFHSPHRLQKTFYQEGAIQCGMCTPGMILSAKALLDRNPSPTELQIRQALDGHICRCSGYNKIVLAIQKAAKKPSE